MSNPAHSGLLKIGQTSKDPLVRRKDLSSTGVPEEFVIEYQALTSDYRRQEKLIHQKLNKVRHSSKKEFFSITVPDIGDRYIHPPSHIKRNLNSF